MTGAMPKRMFGKAGLLRQLTYSKPNTKQAAIGLLATQVLVLLLIAAKSTSDRCVTDNDIAIAVRR